MKPANFPARKNKRRREALARAGVDISDPAWGRVTSDTVARGIRTKKDRSHQAKFTRA